MNPNRQVHFLLQKVRGKGKRQLMTEKSVVGLALFFCPKRNGRDDDPGPKHADCSGTDPPDAGKGKCNGLRKF